MFRYGYVVKKRSQRERYKVGLIEWENASEMQIAFNIL